VARTVLVGFNLYVHYIAHKAGVSNNSDLQSLLLERLGLSRVNFHAYSITQGTKVRKALVDNVIG